MEINLDEELRRSIKYADKTARKLGKNMIVVYSEHGSYQGFILRNNIPEEFTVVYRSAIEE